MPVDPQIQALLDRGTGVPATHTLPVAEARRLYEARIAVMAPPAEVAKVAERSHRRTARADQAADLHAVGQRAVSAHGVLPRQRLRAVQPRYARRHVPQPGGRHRLRRGVGRLPPGARAQVSGRTGRLPGGDPLGGGACGRARRRPGAHHAGRRQRRRQHGRRHGAARARRGRAGAVRPDAALSGDRLSHAGHALLCRERRRLRPDPRHHGVVLGALSQRRRRGRPSARLAAARAGSRRPAAGLCR